MIHIISCLLQIFVVDGWNLFLAVNHMVLSRLVWPCLAFLEPLGTTAVSFIKQLLP